MIGVIIITVISIFLISWLVWRMFVVDRDYEPPKSDEEPPDTSYLTI